MKNIFKIKTTFFLLAILCCKNVNAQTWSKIYDGTTQDMYVVNKDATDNISSLALRTKGNNQQYPDKNRTFNFINYGNRFSLKFSTENNSNDYEGSELFAITRDGNSTIGSGPYSEFKVIGTMKASGSLQCSGLFKAGGDSELKRLTVESTTTLKGNTYVNGNFHVDGQSVFKNSINTLGKIVGVGDISSNGNIYTPGGSIGGNKCLIGFNGIDKTTTNAQMQFDNTITNRKIDLYNYNGESETAFYGFGISPFTLRYQVDSPLASHVFFANNGVNPNELMRIKGDGNVGIGTSNPEYKLAVKGEVGAEDYSVDEAMAADYVFEPDYKLITLSETEKYIKENKHLPAFKSAKHYKEKGYSMIEMNVALEQTVEELTLHAIAQEKEINSMKTELAEIKALLTNKK